MDWALKSPEPIKGVRTINWTMGWPRETGHALTQNQILVWLSTFKRRAIRQFNKQITTTRKPFWEHSKAPSEGWSLRWNITLPDPPWSAITFHACYLYDPISYHGQVWKWVRGRKAKNHPQKIHASALSKTALSLRLQATRFFSPLSSQSLLLIPLRGVNCSVTITSLHKQGQHKIQSRLTLQLLY